MTHDEIMVAVDGEHSTSKPAADVRALLGVVEEAPKDNRQYARKNGLWVSISTSDPAEAIHAAAAKTSLSDADELGVVDSDDGWTLKKITWSALKTLLNGIYALAGHTHSGTYEPANSNIQSHISSTSNPHSTGYAQVGADPLGAAVSAVNGHTSTFDHTKLHTEATVSGPGISIVAQEISLNIGSGANQVASGVHNHSGVYEPSGTAASEVSQHESEYDHSLLHAAATVSGPGISIVGQEISLSIGRGVNQVASGSHTHTLSQITDAGEMAYEEDAPNDGKQYARKSEAWEEVASASGTCDRGINQCRITLESGVAVSTTDQTAKTTVYACSKEGGATTEFQISLLGTDNTTWATHSTAQLSIGTTTTRNGTTTNGSKVISGLAKTSDLVVGQEVTGTGVGASAKIASIDSATQITTDVNSTASATVSITFKCPASKNYDLFLMNIAGTPTLVFGPVWTSDTARATDLTQKDGVAVLSGAFSVGGTSYAEGRLRHVGAVRTTATPGQTESSYGGGTTVSPKRFISSRDNQVELDMMINEDTDGTYNSATWRQYRGQADNQVEFITCVPTVVHARASAFFTHLVGTNSAEAGIGLDRTNAIDNTYGAFGGTGIANGGEGVGFDRQVGAGYHYLAFLQRTINAGGACTFHGTGTSGFASQKTQLSAEVRG